jgi:hypothetical protein
MKTVIATSAALVLISACAHDAPINNLSSSINKLDHDVRRVVASAKNPESQNDPTAFRYRVHQEVVPLRQRLETLRERTNTQVDREENNGKEATVKEEDDRAKMSAKLDEMEQELNAIDTPESGTPP